MIFLIFYSLSESMPSLGSLQRELALWERSYNLNKSQAFHDAMTLGDLREFRQAVGVFPGAIQRVYDRVRARHHVALYNAQDARVEILRLRAKIAQF
jgi:hypothetical protein